MDTDPGALIDGGLAALAIGRCLQRLKEAEKSEGLSNVASGALQKATIRLAAAVQRPDEILSILEHVSSTLVRAQEMHFPPAVHLFARCLRPYLMSRVFHRRFCLSEGKRVNAISEV
jgi:hypothetical protein